MQNSLFQFSDHNQPLAYKVRPQKFDGFYGQDFIKSTLEKFNSSNCPHFILHGPAGTGKTTAALILGNHLGLDVQVFNAVLGGISDLKKILIHIKDQKNLYQKKCILFVDEVHRIHKAAQDALLPYLEKGDFIFIGATTEHPQIVLNKALLSRVNLLKFKTHNEESLQKILETGNTNLNLSKEIIELIIGFSNGDARFALSKLERIYESKLEDIEEIKTLLSQESRFYDKKATRHYDVISAFIKSIRGSNVDAALIYLAIMLDGGEDPVFIARRLMILASEDIGNADIHALTMANNAHYAVANLGMPEARITLSQACIYLAKSPKSNSAYKAIDRALNIVKNRSTIEVPTHLRNYHPDKMHYKYPHNYEGNFVEQVYSNINEQVYKD